MMQYVIGIIIADAIICGILSSYLADKKGYSVGGWFLVGLLFGIFGLIAAAGLPLIPGRTKIQEGTKKCPKCRELMDIHALTCGYCGQKFNEHTLGAVPGNE